MKRWLWLASMMFVVTLMAAPSSSSSLLPSEQNTIDIFRTASPLVVNVHRLKAVGQTPQNRYHVSQGAASGFIWNNQGYVVTNFHVIYGANLVAVTLNKGNTVLAKLVGIEPRKDIALLKIADPKALKTISHYKSFPIADSSKLRVGQKVLAIGNPYGLDHSLTTGIVSALGRDIKGIGKVKISNMIQTDASINPGNSGGPLLNSQGELVGMNTIIVSNSGSSAGIGFAVPSNTIQRVVKQIIHKGRVIMPGLGFQPLSDQVAQQLGVKGVIVSKVLPKTPAAKAKLRGTFRDAMGNIRLGDIIVAINSKTIKNYSDLYNALEALPIGKRIEVVYQREGKLHHIMLTTIDVAKASQ